MNEMNGNSGQVRSSERLYAFLPAIYRIRDEIQGGPLRALLAIIESELNLIEGDIEDLYNNWFIETCDEWAVSYIGDLLSVRDLNAANPRAGGQERRAYVANTLAYRQRKGTTPVLEQLAQDITGWGARAVEPRQLLATTQSINHVRRQSMTADIRRDRQPERLGTPFEERVAYTTEIQRHPTENRGLYNPASVSLYLWRLQSYPVTWNAAALMQSPNPALQGRYFSFNPVGQDTPLFNQPQTQTEIATLAQEINVPAPLTRLVLQPELDRRRADFVNGKPRDPEGYFGENPVFQIRAIYKKYCQIIQPEEILLYDLDWQQKGWQPPTQETLYKDSSSPPQPVSLFDSYCADPPSREIIYQTQVAVDPELGRLACLTDHVPDQVEVSYAYGFSDDVGGGPYSRTEVKPQNPVWMRQVFPDDLAKPNPLVAAVKEWNQIAQTLQYCADRTYIPLARLEIQPDGTIRNLKQDLPIEVNPAWGLRFHPGIVQGLDVFAHIGTSRVVVTSGTAIDPEGNLITFKLQRRFKLKRDSGQTLLVAIVHSDDPLEPEWQVKVFPEADGDQGQPTIPLVRLTMDDLGKISQVDRSVGQPFEPGIITGLQVPEQAKGGQVVITAGAAVNRQGQLIQLSANTPYPVTPDQIESAQTVILFIQIPQEPANQRLGNVPDVDTGIIQVQGNGTYRGNLVLQVPEGKHVQLIAKNGDRPHIKGNLLIRGITTTHTEPPGEFQFEGLLLEGKLVILPGSLKHLHIDDCTLFSAIGSLEVQKSDALVRRVSEDGDDEISLLALILYCLALIRWLVHLGFGTKGLSPQKRLTRLSQVALQHILRLFEGLQQVTEQWQCLPLLEGEAGERFDEASWIAETFSWKGIDIDQIDDTVDFDNSELEIAIRRSICGAIALANTVPNLSVEDSIIDATLISTPDAIEVGAIVATGTAVTVKTSTIFGTTVIRSLEASDSIFTDKVSTLRRQVGCVRFCYLPEDSQTPHRYRCQPDLTLSKQIQNSPVTVTALATNPLTGQLFAGTAGTGIFRFLAAKETWIPFNEGLTNLNITALLADAKPGTGKIRSSGRSITGTATAFSQELRVGDTITAAGQTRTVTKLNTDGSHPPTLEIDTPFAPALETDTPFVINTLLAGSTGGTLFRLTSLIKAGTGVIGNQAEREPLVEGVGTLFEQEANVGDILLLDGQSSLNQSLTVAAVLSDTSLQVNNSAVPTFEQSSYQIIRRYWQPITNSANTFGEGTISSKGIIVTGHGTYFQEKLTVGDTIVVANQTRMVAAILSNETLLINLPFAADLTSETTFVITRDRSLTNTNITTLVPYLKPGIGTITANDMRVTGKQTQFRNEFAVGDTITLITTESSQTQTRCITEIKSDRELTINAPFEPGTGTNTPFFISGILAGTAGNGIFRSTDRGNHWTEINQGLLNLDVRAIAFNPNTGALFAGTQGGGVFRSFDNGHTWIGSEPLQDEEFQSGLANLFITALTVNPGNGDVFAGTAGGGIFRSSDQGRFWQAVNQHLSNTNITTLATYIQQGNGTIATSETALNQLIGTNTVFTTELAIGDAVHAIDTATGNGQTRIIEAIPQKDVLTLQNELEDDLASGSTFSVTTLFAGTSGGKVFRSTDNGETWQPSGTGLSSTDITSTSIWTQGGKGVLSAQTIAGETGTQTITITGRNTAFTKDLFAGDLLIVAGQIRKVLTINSDISLTINHPFTHLFNGSDISFSIPRIVVGTKIGSLFRSGITIGTRTQQTERTEADSDPWRSFNTGFNQIDETLVILNQMQPVFTSERYGDAGYAQLSIACPVEICTGAENDSEMGAFNALKQPQREANLQASLKEYLRFGMQADIVYVT